MKNNTDKKRLNVPLLIFMVSLLFTVMLWDRYFNSDYALDRRVVSYVILICGFLFSSAASIFVLSLEMAKKTLEKEVNTLQDIIPICAYCKKVREDAGFWSQVEKYIGDRSQAKFSHGICPECTERERARISA